MEDLLLEGQAQAYAVAYFGTLSLVALWELASPRRVLVRPLRARWLGNIAVTVIDVLLLRWAVPVTGILVAVIAAQRGWGLFQNVDAPLWLALPMSVALLDLNRYLQHVLLHKVPLLWRLHRLHHTDSDYDFTTQLRFHPLEALLGTAVTLAVIVLLGAPPIAVLAYEVLAAAVGFVQHGNVGYSKRLDRVLRWLVVTPDMHRVHHSAVMRESNRNFGNILPWWDRLFGTYVAQPAAGHQGMTIGLFEYRDEKYLTLPWMLADPFLGPKQGAQLATSLPRPSA